MMRASLSNAHRANSLTVYGTSGNVHGVYGTVAAIFLFQGAYSFGWTPMTVLYPPEVLNYSIRSNGMGVYIAVSNAVG